ncbi:MAG TPA: HU family DNA-binding protein, partial [Clostridiales bacterium]|nr:HU family DNA-binding protein [Clostridiales bacterium]
MNKTELINSIALKSGLSKKNSEAALNAFISSVEESLQIGEKVVLVGFGT